MQKGRNADPIRLPVYESEDDGCTMANGLKISAQIALQRQYIHPHTLHEFSMKIGCFDPEIQFSRLTLVAFDERHKRHKFLVYDGWKSTPPKDFPKRSIP